MKNIEKQNEKIAALVANRKKLQNMMTHRSVRVALEVNTQALAEATGFDKYTVCAIYR